LLQVILIGLGAGSLYALSALGLVLIFRGSGIVNFAQGGFGLVGAYVYWELHIQRGDGFFGGFWPAFIAALLAPAALGFATHYLLMRPLRNAPPVSRMIATVALLVIITSVATLKFSTNVQIVRMILPTRPISILGTKVGLNMIILVGLSLALTMLLWTLYRFSAFGRATTAVSENPRALASLGISPDLIAATNWAVGGALAGFAGVFLTMLLGLSSSSLTSLLLPSLAAAFVGGMRSFPLTFVGGLALGALEGIVARYVNITGAESSVPFFLILILLLVRRERPEGRSTGSRQLPLATSGRFVTKVVVPIVLITLGLAWFVLSATWVDTLTLSVGVACILLSLTLVTGLTGQLSLAQLTLAGVGAWAASRAVAGFHMPFVVAMPIGIAVAVPIGVLVGFPALRARGVNVAIATLAFAVAIEALIFSNSSLTGGGTGTYVTSPTLFGLSVDRVQHPERYFALALAVLLVSIIVVANTRRGGTGRTLLAVRSNERAAASLGINVVQAKLYAFALGAGIAAAGGIVLTFRNSYVDLNAYSAAGSLTQVTQVVVGGIGLLTGGLAGSQLQPGSTSSYFIGQYIHSIDKWLPLIGGLGLIFILLTAPDGIVKQQADQLRHIKLAVLGRRSSSRHKIAPAGAPAVVAVARTVQEYAVPPRTLEAEGISVRFGGVVALENVSIEVRPGQVVGLIGPNGAGKTTLIEVMTGFVRQTSGSIRLDGESLDGAGPHRRSRAGLARSFQTLELFEDMTVRENLLAASDSRTLLACLRDAVKPPVRPLPASAIAAVEEFGLGQKLDGTAKLLAYGDRRLVAIARAVGSGASVLLLDEPAAGLSGPERKDLSVLLRKLAENWKMAVLLVEHDVDLVMSSCDRVVALDTGRVIATGTPAEVRSNPDVIRSYLGDADPETPPTAEGRSADTPQHVGALAAPMNANTSTDKQGGGTR
jgi:ABC-type branched-subunit amino acid transport system ATPase component/ABC-type branched-subunit amino acid transport system permease subunit